MACAPSHAARLAQELAELLGRGELFSHLLAPGATVWHNFDETEFPAEFILQQAALQKQIAPDLHAEDVRVCVFETGFVIEQSVVGTLANGTTFRIPGAIVAYVDGDRIARLREYVTESAAAPVMQAVLAISAGRAMFERP